ncbi:MAG: CHAP domain-containing protein, partial [Lachnospiraceae bacterium]
SGASGVIPNGGGVCQKSYSRNYNKILGYGIPDWSLANKSGWHQEDGGWRYYLGNTGEPICNDWHQEDDGSWYWFDGSGLMVHDTWKTGKDGRWYYLGPDGKMLKDTWLLLGKELYRLNKDGSMFEGTMTLQTDSRGALVDKK